MLVLAVGDQTFEVEQLTDVDPSWQGLKVTSPDLKFPVGTQVEIRADDQGLAGSYIVTQSLGPAAPRTWRLFLEPAIPAAPPSVVSSPDTAVSDPSETNTSKKFLIKVSGLCGDLIRESVAEYRVPYDRLSQEMKRLNKSGAKILSITELK